MQKGLQLPVLMKGNIALFYRVYQHNDVNQTALVLLSKSDKSEEFILPVDIQVGEWVELNSGKKELAEAYPPMSVCMTLEDELETSRGDMLVRVNNKPTPTQDLDVMLCWLGDNKLVAGKKYLIRHTSNEARTVIKEIQYKVDINTLHRLEENKDIAMNDIARVKLRTTKPLLVDAYKSNKATGSFIIVDEADFNTVAAGMII